MNDIPRRLDLLRESFSNAGLDAYLVPSTDPHQSEYLPECWQRRRWLSGFSGSAGDLLVTRDSAALWTDGRYAIQADRELRGSGIELFVTDKNKSSQMSLWAARALTPGQQLGVDPQLISPWTERRLTGALRRSGARLTLHTRNLVDAIWRDRPAVPAGSARPHPSRYAGQSVRTKLRRVQQVLVAAHADAYPIVCLDEIAWLYNLRGDDIAYNPLVIAYGLVTTTRALLFCEESKLNGSCRRHLERAGIEIYSYRRFGSAMQRLARARGRRPRVWIDERRSNGWCSSCSDAVHSYAPPHRSHR
jgi:Xaa-Pro aminopeptidase